MNNIWSAGGGDDAKYSNLLVQPFLNYNLPDGAYLTTAPIITANWKADSGNRWTVPLGGGIGKIFHLGRLPVNTQASAYYNVERPDRARAGNCASRSSSCSRNDHSRGLP